MAAERPEITDSTVVNAAKDQVSADLDGEAVILNMKNGVYYGLDPVGSFIWEQLKQPKTVAELRDAVLGEFEVEPQRCTRDLLDLLGNLASEGLIDVGSE